MKSEIVIAVPRFSLSGGNLISILLGEYLNKRGYEVAFHSGYKKCSVDEINLVPQTKGIINTLKNAISFFALSLYGLFNKNYIATHHLTALFNFIKPCKFSFIQDVECDFYPKKFRFAGNFLWRNYLKSRHHIYTNQYLYEKVMPCHHSISIPGFPYMFEDKPYTFSVEESQKTLDAIVVLRDGQYKNSCGTLKLFELLLKNNLNVQLVNLSRQKLSSILAPYVNNVLKRKDFLSLLAKSKYYICMSEWEGLGLPNLEAYHLGLGIISTPIPSALLIKKHNPESVYITSNFDEVVEIIKSQKLTTPQDSEMFLRKSNEKWLDYAYEVIKKGIVYEG